MVSRHVNLICGTGCCKTASWCGSGRSIIRSDIHGRLPTVFFLESYCTVIDSYGWHPSWFTSDCDGIRKWHSRQCIFPLLPSSIHTIGPAHWFYICWAFTESSLSSVHRVLSAVCWTEEYHGKEPCQSMHLLMLRCAKKPPFSRVNVVENIWMLSGRM